MVDKFVLSFGRNNRSQKDKKKMPVTELKGALKTAQKRFPEAEIFIPVISFSNALPHKEHF